MTKAIDKAELMTYNYKYDGFGNVINSSGGNLRVTNTFDSSNRLAEKLMEYGGEDFVITPTYEKDLDGKIYPDNLINGFSYDNGVTTQTKRDEYGRVTEKQVDFDENSNVITENYRYLKVPNDDSFLLTNMVRGITYNHGGEEETIQYTYDNNGNITAVTKGFDVHVRYEYDEMNQLIREDNKQLNRSYLYKYDNAGNIILKDEHEYIYGEETATLSHKEYTYSNTGWKDKLTSFNGQSITYDALGNPLSYLGHTLTWDRVRQLKTFDNNTFSYDGFGKRCRKNSVYYLYDGDKLIKERRNGTSLVYFYDTTGICGFRYNIFTGGVNSTDYYFYRKNLQGDVTAVLDQNGNVVAEYLYDAWGKCSITYDPIGIGEINPIRYRSYYYDNETGLYYLNSRYYDPNTGRFINADVYVSTGLGLLNCNMYAYCHNNPIIGIDPTGKRTYILNGISNDYSDRSPDNILKFKDALIDAGIEGVVTIPIYTDQDNFFETLIGAGQVLMEMANIDVYTDYVIKKILNDLKNNPLEDGEEVNLIGYSGGGQIALNVMEKINIPIANVILIGTPVCEMWKSSTNVFMFYGGLDILSWNIGWGYKSYFMGWIGHSGYFSKNTMKKLVKRIGKIIK